MILVALLRGGSVFRIFLYEEGPTAFKEESGTITVVSEEPIMSRSGFLVGMVSVTAEHDCIVTIAVRSV